MSMTALVGSGSFDIEQESKEIKYANCVTDGYFSFPQPHAYGTWEFEVFPSNETCVLFIAEEIAPYNVSNSYIFYVYFSGIVQLLKKITAGAMTVVINAPDTVNLNQWNFIKITRTLDGEFKMYINEVLVGTATDTTHTISNFSVIQNNAGERVRNFKHSLGVEQ